MATEPPRRAPPPPPPAGRPESGQRRAGDGEEAEPLRGSALEASSPSVAVGGGRQGLLNGCVPLSHQVAGHMYGKDKGGILQHPDGTVLKQLQPPPRGPREQEFYNKGICKENMQLELHKEFTR